MTKTTKVTIAVPTGRYTEPETLSALRAAELEGHTIAELNGISAVDLARNRLAEIALAEPRDWILWVDSDVEFAPEDIVRLLAHDKPFICGLYPKKVRGQGFAATISTERSSFVLGEPGLVRLHATGLGFALTHRSVYDEIAKELLRVRHGETSFVPYFLPAIWQDSDSGATHYYTEDYAFCARARAAGFDIWAATDVVLRHWGAHGYDAEDASMNEPVGPVQIDLEDNNGQDEVDYPDRSDGRSGNASDHKPGEREPVGYYC